jgi:hypothetical protein
MKPKIIDELMKKICLLLIMIIFAVSYIFLFNSVSALTTEETWVSKTSMPTERACVHTATVNGRIYAIGGGGPTGTNEEYDPQNDTWITRKPMPFPEQDFAITVYQNRIYCIGGEDKTQVYDPATDTWKIKTSMPTARYGAVAEVVNDKIYVIGGAQNLGYNQGYAPLDVNEVYDPTTNTWSTGAVIPYAVPSVSAVVDNKILVIGSQIIQIYDPATNTWSTGTSPMKDINTGGYSVIAAASATTTGVMAPKRIYVYDGTNLQIYNPYMDNWTNGTPPPTSRESLGISVVNDKLYFIGGMSYPISGLGEYYIFRATNEQYTPVGYGVPSASPSASTSIAEFPLVVAAVLSTVAVAFVVLGLVIYLKRRRC